MYDNIIDEYINEVTKDMGAKQREELSKELKTHILDSADALAAERKTPVDAVIIREVIAKMGPAEKLAALYPTKKTFLEQGGLWNSIKGLATVAIMFLLVSVILMLVAPGTVAVIPIQVILNIVWALAMAIIVIIAIFFAIYVYESQLKATYETRLRRLEKSLKDVASPIKVAATIIAIIVWLILVNVFWSKVIFLAGLNKDGIMVPLLTSDFASFLVYINLLGILMIGVQLLYLALEQKWIPSLLETILSIGTALLVIWILVSFPFNPALSVEIVTGIKVMLAFISVGCLFGVAKNMWQTAQLFIHGKYEKSGAV